MATLRFSTRWFSYRSGLGCHSIKTNPPHVTRCFSQSRRHFRIEAATANNPVPLRKQLKAEAKQRKAAGVRRNAKQDSTYDSLAGDWELTVGVEVHAQLNTDRKLFSRAPATVDSEPNSNTALFDLAYPGSQPKFEAATLLPAIRAALALNCEIQRESTFDRKHYFYPDQPSGYQITQYYSPFAKDGYINLNHNDGIAVGEEETIRIGIKQIQMEQDTAKTIQQPPDHALLDFNRAGHPLIEIITLPQIHYPQTAAACVRKIQEILQAVSAVTTGMELGGLRADVNVSVRRRDSSPGQSSYYGVTGLGKRTEIKNLSSFRAVEDAILAEMNRQIFVLESGGEIENETRGWTIGSSETRKLRGKEGEVDYRYMPDADLPPVIIAPGLIKHLTETLPMLPDEQTMRLVNDFGLTMKDAKTLCVLDGGLRLDYFQKVMLECQKISGPPEDLKLLGKLVANWTLMELGGLLTQNELEFSPDVISAASLASIIGNLAAGRITGKTAKDLLQSVLEGDSRLVDEIIKEDGLEIQNLSDLEYVQMASELVNENPEMAESVRQGQNGKLQWFVGQMMRKSQGRVDAGKASDTIKTVIVTG